MAIASGSPWVIPSIDEISPPLTNNLIGLVQVLLSTVDIAGHITLMLCRAAWRLMVLNAFVASTKSIASVSSKASISFIA